MTHEFAPSKHWLWRSTLAGLAAATVGGALATARYLELPGAERLDWGAHFLAIAVYVLFTGLCVGLAIGAGMVLALGRRAPHGSAACARLVLGATAGTMVGGALPAIVGITYFGSFSAPYAGTANLLLSVLAAGTTYVVLWAPVLDERASALSRLPRLGIAALSATVAAASMAALGWTLVSTLDILPSFAWMQQTAYAWGLVQFSAVAGIVVCTWIGLYIGLAAWLDLTLSLALRPAAPRR